jgi:hypothetical protein
MTSLGIEIRDLPACSIVSQPTTLPRAPPINVINYMKKILPWSTVLPETQSHSSRKEASQLWKLKVISVFTKVSHWDLS